LQSLEFSDVKGVIVNYLIKKANLSTHFIKKHKYLFLILFFTIIIHAPKLNKRLTEIDDFRQTQTALGIKSFLRESLNPFNATLPIAGPKSQLPFEFPLFQFLASFPARVISDLDVAARLTGLLSFIVTLILIYFLALKIWNIDVAVIAILIFGFSSFSLQWGAASLIEFTATALILASILVLMNFIENQDNKLLLVLLLVILTLGFTVKITTAIPWLSVIFMIIFLKYKELKKISKFLLSLTILSTALLTVLWTQWADNTKLNQEYWGPGLTSEALRSWNFGTLSMRLDRDDIFLRLSQISDPTVGSSAILIGLVIYSIARLKVEPVSTALAGTIVLGPMIFFPLYGHLYYGAAILPAIALITGASIVSLVSRKVVLFSLTFLIVAASYTNPIGKHYLEHHFKRPGLPDVSRQIENRTDSNAVIMLRCNEGWSSKYLYYADREGLMLRYDDIIPNERAWGSTYQYLAFCNEGNVDLSVVPDTVYLEKQTKLLYKIYRK